jgi:hypothetical protein
LKKIAEYAMINADGTKNYPQYPLGYLFSQTEKEAEVISGFDKAEQYYYANSEEKNFTWVYYFIPSSLSKVILTGSDLTAGAFSGCKKLQEIELPKTVTRIPSYTFNECNKLKSLIFPDGVPSIGRNAFSYCRNLSHLELPNTITSIGIDCLAGIYSISYLTAPVVVFDTLKN